MAYRNLLVAIDLSDGCSTVVERALSLAQSAGTVWLMHVVPPMPIAYATEMMIEQPLIPEEQLNLAREQLVRAARAAGIPAANCRVEFGDAKHEIHRAAAELEADIIVVGSHGRHGLALLLGSTASEVLHGAPCDVLAVRLPTS